MKQNWKKYLLIFVLSLVLMLAISPVRGIWGFRIPTAIYFVTYILLTIWLLKKYSDKIPSWTIVLSIIIGTSAVDIPLRIFDYQSAAMSMPEFVFRIISPLIAWAVWAVRSKTGKFAILFISSALCAWMVAVGYNYWANKVSFGTFTGKVEIAQCDKLNFQTPAGDTVSLADLGRRYVVLDFFTSSCGVCFRKMPLVQALYDKYKDNPNVVICTIHERDEKRGETYATGAQILAEDGYTLPCLSTDLRDPKLQELITCVPTVLIYDQTTKQYIFRGNIEQATDRIEELTAKK